MRVRLQVDLQSCRRLAPLGDIDRRDAVALRGHGFRSAPRRSADAPPRPPLHGWRPPNRAAAATAAAARSVARRSAGAAPPPADRSTAGRAGIPPARASSSASARKRALAGQRGIVVDLRAGQRGDVVAFGQRGMQRRVAVQARQPQHRPRPAPDRCAARSRARRPAHRRCPSPPATVRHGASRTLERLPLRLMCAVISASNGAVARIGRPARAPGRAKSTWITASFAAPPPACC